LPPLRFGGQFKAGRPNAKPQTVKTKYRVSLHKMNIAKTFSAFILILLTCTIAVGQDKTTIRYLNSTFQDTTDNKDVLVVFLVTVPDTSDFPPRVNLPPECTVFENGFEKKVLLSPQNLSVTFDGDQVAEKHPEVYRLVKDSISFDKFKTSMLVSYQFRDIPYTFSKMSVTPSFKEKRNKESRVSKRFVFLIPR
jgi:hypothetical protein